MTFCAKRLRLVLQMQGAVWLLVWLGALFACSIECVSSTCGESSVCESKHPTPAEAGHHQEGTPPQDEQDRSANGFCSSIQSGSFALSQSALAAACVKSVPIADALLFTFVDFTAPQCHLLRQVKHCEWVFTPEVCLGPALRSLAPPLSA